MFLLNFKQAIGFKIQKIVAYPLQVLSCNFETIKNLAWDSNIRTTEGSHSAEDEPFALLKRIALIEKKSNGKSKKSKIVSHTEPKKTYGGWDF